MSPFYEEEIPLLNWIVILPLALLVMIPAIVSAWIELRRWVPRWAIGVTTLLFGGLLFLMMSIKLYVRVDEDGVRYRYFPMQWEKELIPWEEIDIAYCRVHYAEIEYGNWGIAGNEQDKAYTMPGHLGLQLILRDGRRILISISEFEALKRVLRIYTPPGIEKPLLPKEIHTHLPSWPTDLIPSGRSA